MNFQKRADERSKALHKKIAFKLRKNPALWDIPKSNIERWKLNNEQIASAILEWENILNTKTRDQILTLLESDSEEMIRLRSSSPFAGILNSNERNAIFDFYRLNSDWEGSLQ